jgi:hypothetical protein
MVRSKVCTVVVVTEAISSLLTPDPAFSVAILQAEGRTLVFTYNNPKPPSTLPTSSKWTTTRARECVLRSLTPTTLLPSNASATCRGSPTPQLDPTILHHSLRLLLFHPSTCLRLDLRHTPRRAKHIPGAHRCMRLVIMGGLAGGSCSPPPGLRRRSTNR